MHTCATSARLTCAGVVGVADVGGHLAEHQAVGAGEGTLVAPLLGGHQGGGERHAGSTCTQETSNTGNTEGNSDTRRTSRCTAGPPHDNTEGAFAAVCRAARRSLARPIGGKLVLRGPAGRSGLICISQSE